jgi:hypothetical protein
VEAAARIILLLALFGVVLSYVQHGPGGPLRWVRAKYLGRTS